MEAQYFQHDYDARRDPKLIRLRKRMGMEGLGIFWCITEFLYENDNQWPEEDMDAMAEELHTDEDKLRTVIEDFGLFTIEDGTILSPSIARRIKKRQEISGRNATNAKARYGKARDTSRRNESATGLLTETFATEENRTSSVTEVSQMCRNDLADVSQTSRNEVAEQNKKEKENTPIPPTPQGGEGGCRKHRKFDFEDDNKPEWLTESLAPIFHDWLAYKRSRGQGYATEDSAHKCFDSLVGFSSGDPAAARAIVNRSIANNWQGLFALDGHGTATLQRHNMILNTQSSEYKKF